MKNLFSVKAMIVTTLIAVISCMSFIEVNGQIVILDRPMSKTNPNLLGESNTNLACLIRSNSSVKIMCHNESETPLLITNISISPNVANVQTSSNFEPFLLAGKTFKEITFYFEDQWADHTISDGITINYTIEYYHPDVTHPSTASSELYYPFCSSTDGPKNRLSQETNSTSPNILISPNPVKDAYQLNYSLATAANVNIELYNGVGQKVKTLINESQAEGSHVLESSFPSHLKSGVYYIVSQIGDKVTTQKLIKL